jgi:thymidylate synthase (FAD)
MKIQDQSAKLLWVTPDPERTIERAGRVCYKSEGRISSGSAAQFINMLIRRGHEAMLEHASASIQFVCDRGVTHELVRHRLASFAQESTRYCNYALDRFDGIAVAPMMEGLTDEQVDRRTVLYEHMERVYLAEINEGIKPQQARDNLPTCLKTEIVVTANFREWRHILKLRLATTAHPQIQSLMRMAFSLLHDEAPVVFPIINGNAFATSEEPHAS